MALSNCIECGKQISTDAKSCPHCGRRNPTVTNSAVTKRVLIVGAVLLVGAAIASNETPSPSPTASLATSPPRVTAADTARIHNRIDSIAEEYPVTRLSEMHPMTMALVLTNASQYGSSTAASKWIAAVKKESERRERADRIRLVTVAAEATCSRSVGAKAARLIESHAEWPDEILGTIACGQVQIGMTPEQARAAWGAPEDINRSVGSWGVHEQWVYGNTYLYFQNGKLTSFQD
jgi:DNA-directed RNA polymerase subunit RPC12/RpoP